MRVKAGVNLDGLLWPLWYAAAVVDFVRSLRGYGEGTITGGREGEDRIGAARVDRDHANGRAIDIRTRDILPGDRPGFVADLQMVLGPEFVVVLEPDHVHIEIRGPLG